LRQIVESIPGSDLASGGAVILAADTRWTYGDRPPEDLGQKVWHIAPAVGAVFAGDVRAAEEALAKLRRAYRRARPDHPLGFAEIASRVLQRVYSQHRAKRGNVGPLYFLVGMANLRGQTAVLYLSHTSGFKPLFLRGVHAVGSAQACDRFRDALDRAVAESAQDGRSWPMEIDVWAMMVAATLKLDVIDEGIDATVGGRVQLLILDRTGSRTVSVSTTDSDALEPSSWRDSTVQHESLRRYHEMHRVPYLASGELDLRLHHISE
jgi:hypothetical protein